MTEDYEIKAIPVEITAVSRASVKIRDNFYTVEAQEKRMIPQIEGVDMEIEWEDLFKSVDEQVEWQIEETKKLIKAAKEARKNKN